MKKHYGVSITLRKFTLSDNKEQRAARNAGERGRSDSSQRKPAVRRSLEPGRTPVSENMKFVKKTPAKPMASIADDVLPNTRALPAAFQKRKRQDTI